MLYLCLCSLPLMTEAMDNLNFTLLAHPGRRLIDPRSWLEKQYVLNIRPPSELRKLVARQNPGIGY